jgi:23S rRNA (cytidine1920-2'-O)/16S rRNA (cytidine1409-2'-O)-methyltransferase
VNGQRIDKPGTTVPEDAAIQVRGRRRYAGRGGYKLAAALDRFNVSVSGRVALDCGASTGGFTDCLLQRGASLVYAIEVGHGQLAGFLRLNPRVRNLERTNLGGVTPEMLDPRPDLITLDLSYLSLTAALPLAAALLAASGEVLALFKPLFEVDDPRARRTGHIADPHTVLSALGKVLDTGDRAGLTPVGAEKLALRPRHGVAEFVLHFAAGDDRGRWRYDSATLEAISAGPGIGETEEDEP